MRVVSFAQHLVPPALRAQVTALQDQAWPSEPGQPTTEHDPALRPVDVLLLDDHDAVSSALAILSKTLTHDGQQYAACGLSTVVTDPAHRGHGHGHQLITAAREFIAVNGADLSVFTCDRALAGFYQHAGWQVLPGTVLIGGTPDAPFPSDQFDRVTLIELITGHARDHAASFDHARIEVYPGEIDRLW